MVMIPPGEYTVGSDEPKGPGSWYAPAHKVETKGFHIDTYEITFEQYMNFSIESDYRPEGEWRQYYRTGRELYPVSNVTYDDAKAYCEWAGERLPTEEEWEIAARGAEARLYTWGDEWDATMTNTNERGYSDTVEVGAHEADKSVFGAYDMVGNVQEWTSSSLKPYRRSPVRNEDVFRMNYRTVRGASYAIKGKVVKLFTRFGYPDKAQYGTGFRCVKDLTEEEAAAAAAAAAEAEGESSQ